MPHNLPESRIVEHLARLGWVDDENLSPDELTEKIKAWQEYRGLVVDGEIGRVGERELTAWGFCGCPEPILAEANAGVRKWGKRELTIARRGSLPGLSDEHYDFAIREACRYWSAVCGVRFELIDDPSRADIVHIAANLGGPGGVLADMHLPTSSNHHGQLTGRVDTRERWVISEQPRGGVIDLVRVLCHEIGHALGIGHIAVGNLLAAMYSPTIRKPQTGDIREGRRRYGPPIVEPDPDGTDYEVLIRFADVKGEIVEVIRRPAA